MLDRWRLSISRRSAVRGVVLVVALLMAAVGIVQTVPSHASSASCSVSSKLVSSCGVWWGVHTENESYGTLTSLESKLGRKFNLVYDFHTVQQRLPDPDEVKEVQSGRLIHIADSTGGLSWGQVAAGAADSSLRQQAIGLKGLGKTVFFSFDHEMDAKTAYNHRGTAAQYVAAYRHVHNIFTAAGATNVVWVWTVTGYIGNAAKWPLLWPGASYVDWISGDPYAGVNCTGTHNTIAATKNFSQTVDSFYGWAHSPAAARAGIPAHIPEMLSEYAAAYDTADPSLAGRWYEGIPAGLAAHPDVKGLSLFDATGGLCNYTIDNKPPVLAGFKAAGLNHLVRPSVV